MKRKAIAVMSVIFCAVLTMTAATACDFLATDPDGRSPYDVAVSNGYQGSEESWLAKGESGASQERKWYQEAVESGEFTGTFWEFLSSIGAAEGEGSAAANTALRSTVAIYSFFKDAYMAGSGVVYSLTRDEEGRCTGEAYILTNYHCVYQTETQKVSDDIAVYLYGNETFKNGNKGEGAITATFVGGAMHYDIAVLKISNVPALTESGASRTYVKEATGANSDAVTVGESAYVVGNAVGAGISVTDGVVSVAYEELTTTAVDGKTRITLPEIRTSAAVNHGNSGGGLYNGRGELIGLVNARRESHPESAEGTVAAIGYALPANFALAVAENIIDNAGALNVAQLDITPSVTERKVLFDDETNKFYVEEKMVILRTLEMGGAGFAGGLRNGDTLVRAVLKKPDGTELAADLTREYKLTNLLLNVRKDDKLVVTVSREGQSVDCEVFFSQDGYFQTIS